MKRIIILFLSLLPGISMAHPLPVEHEHQGLLNGWEPVLIAVLIIGIVVFFLQKRKTERQR